jgi:hypothetical protein
MRKLKGDAGNGRDPRPGDVSPRVDGVMGATQLRSVPGVDMTDDPAVMTNMGVLGGSPLSAPHATFTSRDGGVETRSSSLISKGAPLGILCIFTWTSTEFVTAGAVVRFLDEIVYQRNPKTHGELDIIQCLIRIRPIIKIAPYYLSTSWNKSSKIHSL